MKKILIIWIVLLFDVALGTFKPCKGNQYSAKSLTSMLRSITIAQLQSSCAKIHKHLYTEICYDVMQSVRYTTNQNNFKLHVLMANALRTQIETDVNSHCPNNTCVTIKSDCGNKNENRKFSDVFITVVLYKTLKK